MISNSFTNSLQNLTADACYNLAEYFEAQAVILRRQGDEKIAAGERAQEVLKRDIEQQKKLALAGQMALDLYEKGCEKSVSCGKAATVFGLRLEVVTANLEDHYKEKQARIRDERYQDILKLHATGLAVRKIALQVGCSKSTAQEAIMRNRRIQQCRQRAVNMRKKGLRAHRIAKTLNVHVNEVFEMLEKVKL